MGGGRGAVALAGLAACAWGVGAECPATDEFGTREKWIIDHALVLISHGAYAWLLGVGALFGLLLLLLCASFLLDSQRKEGAEPIAAVLFPAFTSYFGLIYVTYVFTVPFFGMPADGLLYPEAPHLSPEPRAARSKDVLIGLLYNGVWLALSAYLLIIAIVLVLGLCLILPVALLVLGSVILICRTADWVDIRARAAISRGEYRISVNKETGGNSEGSQADELLGQGCCLFSLKFSFEFTRFFLFAFSVTFKAFFDFLLMFSVHITWPYIYLPSFHINFDFDWPNIFFDMFSFRLPCFRLPELKFGCAFTAQFYELLILSAATITVAVLISSDVMVMLYDRIDRCKMIKLSIFKREERWAFIRHTFLLQVIQGCMFLCWKVVEVITSFAAVSVIQTVRLFLDLRGEDFEEQRDCQVALYGVSKVVTAYVLLIICVQIVRVGTGHVQRNLIYVCSVPLTQSDYPLCQRSQVRHLIAVLKLSVGSFLMPFINLGIRGEGLRQVQEAIESQTCVPDRSKSQLSLSDLHMMSSRGFEERKAQAKELGTSLNIVLTYLDAFFYKCFGAGAVLQAALLELHGHQQAHELPPGERARGPLGRLQIGAVSVLEYVKMCRKAADERKKAGWCQGMEVMVRNVLGSSNQPVLHSVRALGRSNLWQSQLESVHLASGNCFGITLQTLPLVGIFLGKVTMYLNEHPTWVTTLDVSHGARSFRWHDGELSPSRRLQLLYLFSVLKTTLLMCAFFTGKVLIFFILIFVTAFFEGIAAEHLRERSKLSRIQPTAGARRAPAPPPGGGPSNTTLA